MNTFTETGASPIEKLAPNHHRVCYGMSWEQRLQQCHLAWVHDKIKPERFPIVGEGEWEFEDRLLNIEIRMSTTEALEKIRLIDKGNPWKEADPGNFLAFRARNFRRSLAYPIIALGGSANGKEFLCFRRYQHGCYMDFGQLNSLLNPGCSLLLIRSGKRIN